MSTRQEWIAGLIGEVETRKRRIKELENRAMPTMQKLRSAFQSDVDDINAKLKEERALILFKNGVLSFEVRHDGSKQRIEVSLLPDDEILRIEDTSHLVNHLVARSDKDGGISFFEVGTNLVTPEQLSQRFIDSLVRAAYKVPKRQ